MLVLKNTLEKLGVPNVCSQENNLPPIFPLHFFYQKSKGPSPRTNMMIRNAAKGKAGLSYSPSLHEADRYFLTSPAQLSLLRKKGKEEA
jgi:hypothetical protein